MNASVCFLRAFTIGAPRVRFGTKCPSCTQRGHRRQKHDAGEAGGGQQAPVLVRTPGWRFRRGRQEWPWRRGGGGSPTPTSAPALCSPTPHPGNTQRRSAQARPHHYVHVKPVRALGNNILGLVGQPGKVASEHRWGNDCPDRRSGCSGCGRHGSQCRCAPQEHSRVSLLVAQSPAGSTSSSRLGEQHRIRRASRTNESKAHATLMPGGQPWGSGGG